MILAIIFILVITLAIGLPLTLWIAPKHNTLGRLGLSYLMGVGIFTLFMYAVNLLGLKLIFGNITLLLLVLSVPLIFSQRRNIGAYRWEIATLIRKSHTSFIEKIFLSGSALFVISSFINTFYWPVYIWDALTLYDFRAYVFAQTGFIKTTLSAFGGSYYFGYPLLTSLSHSIIYLSGGSNPQFLYSLFYLSLALVFYGLLREFLARDLSLLFTFMLLTLTQIFNQSVVAYTNLPYLAYFSLGAIYFYIWDKKRTKGYLILSATLIGLSTWTRSTEPFWLVIFGLVFLTALYRRKILDIMVFSLIFFPIQELWKNFQSTASDTGSTLKLVSGSISVLSISNILNFQRWQEVLTFLYKGVVIPWGPLFALFLAALLFATAVRKIGNIFLIYLITFSLFALLLFGTFILSFTFPSWSEIPDSASRASMIFYPLFIYCIALVFGEIKIKNK